MLLVLLLLLLLRLPPLLGLQAEGQAPRLQAR
jgi:hypothetical protein